MPHVLISGANGFVGSALCQVLVNAGFKVSGLLRSPSSFPTPGVDYYVIPDLNEVNTWQALFAGVDVVIHLAARAHVMRETEADSLKSYKRSNSLATQIFAEQAARFGVKKFIYLSSIKVLGEANDEQIFNSSSKANPQDPYALTKFEGEQFVELACKNSAMEWVIIRPPLIYGSGVKGNFYRLLKLVQSGLPLPLKSINNQRSMLYLGNLCDFLRHCCTDNGVVNQIYLVSDNEFLSTSELLELIAHNMNKSSKLFTVPLHCLYFFGRITGKHSEIKRLCENLKIDYKETCNKLNWTPPYTVSEGIALTVKSFMDSPW